MTSVHLPANKGRRPSPSRFSDDVGFNTECNHDIISLLEENARLRALVTQLSSLVLKHVAEQK